jgi:hypothetical protein
MPAPSTTGVPLAVGWNRGWISSVNHPLLGKKPYKGLSAIGVDTAHKQLLGATAIALRYNQQYDDLAPRWSHIRSVRIPIVGA